MVVDNEIDIRTARWATLAAACKAQRGEPFRAEAAMAKLLASEGASRVVDRAIQIHGGAGVSNDFPLAYMYAMQRTLRLADGPDEVHRAAVGKFELDKYAKLSG